MISKGFLATMQISGLQICHINEKMGPRTTGMILYHGSMCVYYIYTYIYGYHWIPSADPPLTRSQKAFPDSVSLDVFRCRRHWGRGNSPDQFFPLTKTQIFKMGTCPFDIYIYMVLYDIILYSICRSILQSGIKELGHSAVCWAPGDIKGQRVGRDVHPICIYLWCSDWLL